MLYLGFAAVALLAGALYTLRRPPEPAETDDRPYLWKMQLRTVARFADAVIPVDDPEVSPEEVARELDRFLCLYASRRKWRIKYVILGLELSPLVCGRLPLSLMARADRRAFVAEKLRSCRGLWGKVSMGKQLVLLAYYGRQASDRRMGFVPFEQRERFLRMKAAEQGRRTAVA